MEEQYKMLAAIKCIEIFDDYTVEGLCGLYQCVIDAWNIGRELKELGFPHCLNNANNADNPQEN